MSPLSLRYRPSARCDYIVVEPQQWEDNLADCLHIIELARRTPACLGFVISADLLDAGRINVFERWESRMAVEAFRSSGPSDTQRVAMLTASVAEYDVADVRSLI
ncbi:putative quinol monooxygenase [Nonomuraea sp. GTA35]|uniref:putative quinol monooxygenase n=1 Tax=Nonomuraea sp. GTA35 TaxID=1676746 RepID=UPI0035BF801C